MSDPLMPPDRAAGAPTQGGRAPRLGNSKWWIGAAIVLAALVLVAWWVSRPAAPAENGTSTVSGELDRGPATAPLRDLPLRTI